MSPTEPGSGVIGRLGFTDPWLPAILILGLLARALLPWLWPDDPCVFDECTYLELAQRIRAGEGMTATEQWLWAPGYPYLIAIVDVVSRGVLSIHHLQGVLGLVCIVLVHRLAEEFAGLRAARIAAVAFAVHPTFVFYSGRTWSEPVYMTVLLALVVATRWSREGAWWRALVPGVVVGSGILLRGLAAYVLPVLLVALLWPVGGPERSPRWRHALAAIIAAACMVVPYSISATQRHGGFVISDAVLGRMMWLGNNDYPPITYDFGNGIPLAARYAFPKRAFRPACDARSSPVALNDCEVANGLAWIRANPVEFAARIPYRAAQLFNPNSFLTRHVRTGRYPGMPDVVAEGVVILVVLMSFWVFLGGAAGFFARVRDPFDAFPVAIIALHIGAICMLAGLTRYRVAWEPLVVVYAAACTADPRGCWDSLMGSRLRMAGFVLTLAALVPLMGWFLAAGFPQSW